VSAIELIINGERVENRDVCPIEQVDENDYEDMFFEQIDKLQEEIHNVPFWVAFLINNAEDGTLTNMVSIHKGLQERFGTETIVNIALKIRNFKRRKAVLMGEASFYARKQNTERAIEIVSNLMTHYNVREDAIKEIQTIAQESLGG